MAAEISKGGIAMETQGSVTAETLRMKYVAEEPSHESGIKPSRSWDGKFLKGKRVVAGSNGSYVTITPAHFVLMIKIGDKIYEVWTERIFRDLLGVKSLPSMLRKRITETMPLQVEVVEKEGMAGKRYYALIDSCAKRWVKRVKSTGP